jgi:hypothetical protein
MQLGPNKPQALLQKFGKTLKRAGKVGCDPDSKPRARTREAREAPHTRVEAPAGVFGEGDVLDQCFPGRTGDRKCQPAFVGHLATMDSSPTGKLNVIEDDEDVGDRHQPEVPGIWIEVGLHHRDATYTHMSFRYKIEYSYI